MISKKQVFPFLILSGFLFTLPFYTQFSGIIMFVAWIPLLFVEDYLTHHKEKYGSGKGFLYASVTFLIWNTLTIYWIKNATLPGAIAAVIINSFVMTVAFWLIHLTHRTLGDKFGYFGFLMIWTGYEHFYLNAEISFPWLNMGNAFAKDYKLIQWYEYTGSLGGTIWILMINLLLFLLIRHYIKYRNLRSRIPELVVLLLLIIFPITASLLRYHQYRDKGTPYEVVIIQPNIDPYNDKFGGLSPDRQMDIILHLADSLTTDSTDYVVVPETAINDNVWENDIALNRSIRRIKVFTENHPGVKFITGATTYRAFPGNEPPTPTAHKFSDGNGYYDAYNTALQIDTSDVIQIYHKSQLVVGVEKMPYPGKLKFLEKLFIDLGGATGSYATQPDRTPLYEPGGPGKVAAVICYESVFGEYVTKYVRNGANMIFIITNDGWWGDTPGYKQHMSYARLRAIETRRSIARSANTGISCFINQRGDDFQATGWWVPAAIRGTIRANDQMTYYTLHGDYLARVCDFFAIITLLYTLVRLLMNRSGRQKSLSQQ